MSLLAHHNVFRFQNGLLYGIALFIPLYPRLVPFFIVPFGLVSLFAIFRGYSRVNLSLVAKLLLVLFAIHLIGMGYTDNADRGWFSIEVKLSLMAFPIAFIGFRFLHQRAFHRMLEMFVWGSVAASLYCFAQSAYKVLVLGKPTYYFITSRFSVIVHQNYFSLYLIFAMAILIYLNWPLVKLSRQKMLLNFSALLLLSTAVILTGSKTGFIMWLLLAFGLTVVLVRQMKQKWVPVVVLAIVLGLVGLGIRHAPILQSRIINVLKVAQGNGVNPASTESTAVRTLVYASATEVISTQPWYGSGTGDYQDVLDQVYQEKGYVDAYERHLNAHNLFLQSWLTHGLPGLLVIVAIFVALLWHAVTTKDMISMVFTILFFIISMTESTLNVQAGVVFFSFFSVLLSRKRMWEQPD